MPDSILIITTPDIGIGYKLAGAEVYEASTASEVTIFLRKTIKEPDIALIGIDEMLFNKLDPRFLEILRKRPRPLVLPIQSVIERGRELKNVEDYIRELTLSTAGVIVNVDKDTS
ncbi:MAG: V-type ATP synthase subunit F [Candidatus Thorarchaeota archaeon]